jgi:hypothetical protein
LLGKEKKDNKKKWFLRFIPEHFQQLTK